MKLPLVIGAFAAILIFNTPTLGDSILCENGAVSTGDTKAEVLERCGKPLSITAGEDSASRRVIEILRYAIDGRFRDFYIERGVLKTIEEAGLADE